jgi:hypothetical protein
MKHLKHTFTIFGFNATSPLLLGRIENHWRVQFTSVELADSAEIIAPAEKATVCHSGGEGEGLGEGLLVATPGTSRHRKGT